MATTTDAVTEPVATERTTTTTAPQPARRAGPPRRPRGAPLSIRLVVIVLLLMAGVMVLVGGLTLRLARDHLERSLDRQLTGAVESFQEGPATRVTTPELLATEAAAWLAAQATPSDQVVAVRASTGEVLATTGGLDLRQIHGRADLLQSRASRFWNLDGPNGSVRALTVPIILNGEQAGTIVAAADRDSVGHTLDTLRGSIILAGVIGLGLATVLAFGAIRRTLRPLTRMAADVDDVQRSGDLSRRVAVDGPADEVGRLAEAFNRLLASLDEALESQRHFVSDASHELRTPLTVARGHLELLEGELHDASAQASQAAAVAEIDRMSRIVDDLLLLARLDEGLELRREPVEIEHVLEEARLRAERLGAADVHMVVEEPDLSVTGDYDRLLRVVTNLVTNAVQHGGDGVSITLTTWWEPRAVVIEVADTGRGIPEAELPHIFERLHTGPDGDGGGAGLGLAIAASLTRALGGDIAVASTPGTGTRFTISLPPR